MRVSVVRFGARNAAAALAASLRDTGFGIILDAPIDSVLLEALQKEWLAFFGTEAKHAYLHQENWQDGYFPPPLDQLHDKKEFFHVRPGGLYPAEVSDAALRYFDQAKTLAVTLLGWLEAQTPPRNAAPTTIPLSRMLDGSTGTTLRIQHYLPLLADTPPGHERALAHHDINLLTVLPAPAEPGLQVLDLAGAWHDIPASPGAIIINAGEMLQVATDGRYPATKHRVLAPAGAAACRSRVSLPLFVHPAGDVELAPGRTAARVLAERVALLEKAGWKPLPGGSGPPAR